MTIATYIAYSLYTYTLYIGSITNSIASYYMYVASARNNSRPLAIFQPISAFGRPKSIWLAKFPIQWDGSQ